VPLHSTFGPEHPPPHDACCPLHSPQLNADNVTKPPGDGLPNLSVADHARYDGHFACKTDLHVIQSSAYLNIAQRIDVSSLASRSWH
jgi:hypothetical protein